MIAPQLGYDASRKRRFRVPSLLWTDVARGAPTQGRNDTRTPARQMEISVAKAQSLRRMIEIHWYDAGHMEIPVEQEIQHVETMLRFAWGTLQSMP